MKPQVMPYIMSGETKKITKGQMSDQDDKTWSWHEPGTNLWKVSGTVTLSLFDQKIIDALLECLINLFL